MGGLASIGSGWLVGIGTLAVAGVVLLWIGLFLRRRGETPYCAKCGYNLTGIDLTADGARCPECGRPTRLGAGVVRGERKRRPGLIAAGSVLAILSLGAAITLGVAAYRNFDWYTIKPAAWVFADLESSSNSIVARAIRELRDRLFDGKLSNEQVQPLIAFCLREQASASPRDGIASACYEVLNSLFAAKGLDAQQRDMYLTSAVDIRLRARPIATVDEPCPMKIDAVVRALPGKLSFTYRLVRMWHCDREIEAPFNTGYACGTSWGGMGGNDLVIGMPGKGELRCECDVFVYGHDEAERNTLRFGSSDVSGTVLFKLNRIVAQVVDVRRDGDGGFQQFVKSPEIDAAMRSAIGVSRVFYYPERVGGSFVARIEVNPSRLPAAAPGGPPLSLNFEVFIEVGGKAAPGSDVFHLRGDASRSMSSLTAFSEGVMIKCPPPINGAISVILRTNRQAVLEGTDIDPVWDGELRFDDVPVKLDTSADAPTTAPASSAAGR